MNLELILNTLYYNISKKGDSKNHPCIKSTIVLIISWIFSRSMFH